jgi:hypothetical protein
MHRLIVVFVMCMKKAIHKMPNIGKDESTVLTPDERDVLYVTM